MTFVDRAIFVYYLALSYPNINFLQLETCLILSFSYPNILYFLAVGNMRHLIVEACIARNLLDTSAYFWPGYVNACSNQLSRNVPSQVTGWSSLMKGSPLTPALVNALISTPASRYAPFVSVIRILKVSVISMT